MRKKYWNNTRKTEFSFHNCMRCGKEFGSWNIHKRKYCSRDCANKSTQRYGPDHHNWKGGPDSIQRLIRESKEYIEWRNSIYIRDNYTCQDCGQIGHELHAHHIISLALLLKLHNVKDVEDAINSGIIFNRDNGLTLCSKCHMLTDNYLTYEKGTTL